MLISQNGDSSFGVVKLSRKLFLLSTLRTIFSLSYKTGNLTSNVFALKTNYCTTQRTSNKHIVKSQSIQFVDLTTKSDLYATLGRPSNEKEITQKHLQS